ncbi:hypothetical protein GGS21DRAFT_488053 [Xylaria nigripes]|nr:hypothetical protein GGS21DRAFT_488053 [Xylaria nigripes]
MASNTSDEEVQCLASISSNGPFTCLSPGFKHDDVASPEKTATSSSSQQSLENAMNGNAVSPNKITTSTSGQLSFANGTQGSTDVSTSNNSIKSLSRHSSSILNPTSKPFIPMGLNHSPTHCPGPPKRFHHDTSEFRGLQVSAGYKGSKPRHRTPVGDRQHAYSTSLWITALPPTFTYADLLGAMRKTGKILATAIKKPNKRYGTSAAKVTFFDLKGRDLFLARVHAGKFTFGNYIPFVRPNWYKAETQPYKPWSRVLIIKGPEEVVNRELLDTFFRKVCAYDTEYVKNLPDNKGGMRLEWAFGSFICQSLRLYGAIKDRQRAAASSEDVGWRSVEVRYGRDPCEVAEDKEITRIAGY